MCLKYFELVCYGLLVSYNDAGAEKIVNLFYEGNVFKQNTNDN